LNIRNTLKKYFIVFIIVYFFVKLIKTYDVIKIKRGFEVPSVAVY